VEAAQHVVLEGGGGCAKVHGINGVGHVEPATTQHSKKQYWVATTPTLAGHHAKSGGWLAINWEAHSHCCRSLDPSLRHISVGQVILIPYPGSTAMSPGHLANVPCHVTCLTEAHGIDRGARDKAGFPQLRGRSMKTIQPTAVCSKVAYSGSSIQWLIQPTAVCSKVAYSGSQLDQRHTPR
jgi:hypothetical protein